ncbi:relaxase/mobilization nuclease domain-containing protein [Dyadobacter sp. CY345]|uniref:relaxase/mobilization nuclease domain-containing protein n=1 Tax=Dyadobacter sp. CY345 TaxID=2909335 RepID=UPI001F44BD3B|nr:relaxase/mobilization nuclease domain-containing protein [Dyadobacter sp. CY345]MCF2443244.1 relaxase/mobilization nuclease domain-containing protein [Dyadobacter sp. CY345]
MVAIIKTGHSIQRSFYYNENKISQGDAQCIMAANYPKDLSDLNQMQRLNMLLKTAALNENVKRNSVHISLNFDPSEKLSKDQLSQIAGVYMDKIGFKDQPFLVYEHYDAGHPHIHIMSVKVRPDGSRIETNNIGRNESEKARKQIEIDFGLMKAEAHKRQFFELKPVNITRAQYGKSQTKHAISNVLNTVLNAYKYTSVAELNTLLRQYNVLADIGSKDSRINKNKGLVYRILDEKGQPVGVPIKASDFHFNPGLKYLGERFIVNENARQPHKARVKNAIDLALMGTSKPDLQGLASDLDKQGIKMVLRQNDSGIIYGITYVDHRTKSVFNGSSLGKQYSANAIQERCRPAVLTQISKQEGQKKQANRKVNHEGEPFKNKDHVTTFKTNSGSSYEQNEMLDSLLDPVKDDSPLPFGLRKKKKRKQKNISNSL